MSLCDRLSPVELDEHQVPDLQHVRVIHVHQVGGVSPADAVVVDLAAGATGAGVSHLPEVILHTARQDASLLHPEETTGLFKCTFQQISEEVILLTNF